MAMGRRAFFQSAGSGRRSGRDNDSPPLFIALTVTVVVSGVRQWQWRLLILPALMLLIALQIYATPKTIGMHHWTMIHPLPHLVAGAGFQLLWGRIARPIVVKTALVTALTIVLAVNVLIISEYQDRFRQTGGSGLWSAAIYDLASRLQRDYPQRKLLLMDWGLNHTLFFLSAGELRTTEPFWDLVGGLGHEERIKKLLREPGAVFVFNAPAGALYPEIYLEFQRVVAAIGPDRVSEEKVFDRRGIWVYSIVEVTSLNGSDLKDHQGASVTRRACSDPVRPALEKTASTLWLEPVPAV
jgi:hypothetical protein